MVIRVFRTLVIFCVIAISTANVHLPFIPKSAAVLSLNGEWTVRNGNGSVTVNATVPGGIYTDLMRAQIIGDPYYHNNDDLYRWIGYENWTFFKTFEVECEVLQKNRVILVMHGLDTISDIILNGNHIGESQNMFVRHIFDVKDVLQANNSIFVAFKSAVTYAKQQHEKQVSNYVIPPTCPPPVQNGECHVNYVRKIQSSFSWDWGPSFPSQGIWKPVEIIGFDTTVIRDVTVATVQQFLEGQLPLWSLKINVSVDLAFSVPIQSNVSILLDGILLHNTTVTINPDYNFTSIVSFTVLIPQDIKIKQWWPNGLGEQPLYKLKIIFSSGNEKAFKVIKIGFRTVELVQEPVINSTGLSFYFKVNGVKFFAKGSNWIPADSFFERISPDYIRHLLQSAKDVHMNMIRVWGGGAYETDEFYQIADELGIFIWQDIMFACALYPTDSEFLKSVTMEVEQQVRRLQHHPSLLLWAGNNENEQALVGHWWPAVSQRYEQYKNDYLKLYVDTIMPVVHKEDPSHIFLISSPSNGKKTEEEGWISSDPQDVHYGDVHFYTYNRDSWDWKSYPRGRFISEYGFQSYPSFETLANVSEPSDWTYPSSGFLKHRQHHMFGDLEISTMIAKHLVLPSASCGQKSFEDLLYLSQVVQATAIKTETEMYRRSQSSIIKGEGQTMGALYWQLNSIWQAPSWSSIEYGGKWKMLHYYAKDFFAAVLVSPFEDDGLVKVSVISDLTKELKNLSLNICVYKWSNFTPTYCESTSFDQPAIIAQEVYVKNISGNNSILDDAHCSSRFECFIYFTLTSADGKLLGPNNFLLLSEPNQIIGLEQANIRVMNVSGPFSTIVSNTTFKISLSTTHISLFVWLDIPNVCGRFSENGFLINKDVYSVLFYSKPGVKIRDITDKLQIKTITDVCK